MFVPLLKSFKKVRCFSILKKTFEGYHVFTSEPDARWFSKMTVWLYWKHFAKTPCLAGHYLGMRVVAGPASGNEHHNKRLGE